MMWWLGCRAGSSNSQATDIEQIADWAELGKQVDNSKEVGTIAGCIQPELYAYSDEHVFVLPHSDDSNREYKSKCHNSKQDT